MTRFLMHVIFLDRAPLSFPGPWQGRPELPEAIKAGIVALVKAVRC
jgi:hypothetical protein